MKKFLTVLLSVCVLASLLVSFAVSSSAAEDIEVTVGQRFEWNDQSADSETQKNWRLSGGQSADGLWSYQVYVFAKSKYIPTVLGSDGFAWAATPGSTGIGYARARGYGKNFHPGEAADIAKVFTCPSGGTITVDTTINRVSDWVNGENTPSSIAFYLEDQLVWPTAGEYEVISSKDPRSISFDVDVMKGQRLYIRIGCVDGNQSGDAVEMENFVTYKAVNDSVAELPTETEEDTISLPTRDSVGALTGPSGNNNETSDNGSGTVNVSGPSSADEGSGVGLIIGIVAGVAVVAAVVVVIVLKKKK